jgi:septum formation protein
MAQATRQPKLVLASSSPRRRELLEQAGYDFVVTAPSIPEPDDAFNGLTPAQQAESLAYFKAAAVAEAHPLALVLGADTIVAAAGHVLGKADDEDEARQMLTTLSGTRHEVVTGVAVLAPDGRRLIASDTTFVRMRKMTPGEIEQYVQSGEWKDKAGAYAIQETADRFIEGLEGSFSNVVGLPLELVARMIKMMQRTSGHKEA